jgi:hypothetical protein
MPKLPSSSPVLEAVTVMVTAWPASTSSGVIDRLDTDKLAGRVDGQAVTKRPTMAIKTAPIINFPLAVFISLSSFGVSEGYVL